MRFFKPSGCLVFEPIAGTGFLVDHFGPAAEVQPFNAVCYFPFDPTNVLTVGPGPNFLCKAGHSSEALNTISAPVQTRCVADLS